MPILNDDLALGGVCWVVGELGPIICEGGELGVEAIAAERVEYGFDLAAELLGGVGGLKVAGCGSEPAVEGLIDLALDAGEIDAGADEDAG